MPDLPRIAARPRTPSWATGAVKAALLLVWGGLLGFAASRAGLPLPWMIGPLVGTAALSLAGLPVAIHTSVRKAGQLGAAVAIGTTFTAPVLEGMVRHLPVILGCGLISIAIGLGVALIQCRVAGTGFRTSYFACLPGGVAEMSVLAERYGGETSLVALAQSLRVIVIVLTIPFLLTLFHGGQLAGPTIALTGAGLWLPGLALMLGLAAGIGYTLDRLRVMNAYFLGGLAVGILATVGPLSLSPVPQVLINAAQVMIGVALGGRLDPALLRRMGRFLPATLGATGLLILGNGVVAIALAPLLGIDLASLILASAPGGIAEMSLTAKALHLAVPLVTAFHLVRILLIISLAAPLYLLTQRLFPAQLTRS